jgi:predicted nucleic acid-binding Zn ribbon protein
MTTWRATRPGIAEREPRPVADSLDGVTRGWGAPRAQLVAAVFTHWEHLVGPDIAAHAEPRSLRDGVLVVAADQPAWAAQLRYMTADLLARIRSETATQEITEIQIRVGGPAASEGRDPGRRSGRRDRARGGHPGPVKSPPSGRM